VQQLHVTYLEAAVKREKELHHAVGMEHLLRPIQRVVGASPPNPPSKLET
jgi:hypothetical protein